MWLRVGPIGIGTSRRRRRNNNEWAIAGLLFWLVVAGFFAVRYWYYTAPALLLIVALGYYAAAKRRARRIEAQRQWLAAPAPPLMFPGRFTDNWFAANVPTLHPEQIPTLIGELRARGWAEDRIDQRVGPYLPHR